MEKNYRILLTEAMIATKELCEMVTGEEHEIIRVEVELPYHNILRDYATIALCKKGHKREAQMAIKEQKGKSVEDIKNLPGICHLTTFEEVIKQGQFITFDKKDTCLIKADISPEYEYIDNFFNEYIDFRDNLIKNKEVVKIDHLFQYLYDFKEDYKDKQGNTKVRTK